MRILRPIIWLISLLLVISLTRSVVTLLQKRQIVVRQREELARLQEANAKLNEALSQAETPEYIEREAREKLGLVKDGETVVILPKINDQSSISNTQQGSYWQQWWGLFF